MIEAAATASWVSNVDFMASSQYLAYGMYYTIQAVEDVVLVSFVSDSFVFVRLANLDFGPLSLIGRSCRNADSCSWA